MLDRVFSTPLIRSLHKKMKFSIKDFFSKCDQIWRFLWIWSHLFQKSLMGNFFFVHWLDKFKIKSKQQTWKKIFLKKYSLLDY